MQRRRTAVQEAWTIPAIGYLSGYLAFMAGIFWFLHWLMQPVAIVNAGQSAYIPPPQTRLEPLPRKMDAPALVDLAEIKPLDSPLAALAKVEETTASSNNGSSRPTKKRSRTEAAPREPRRAYAERSAYYQSYDRSWQRSYRSWW